MILFGPPGTGKTRACLDYWIVRAIESGVSPDDIISCSFTRAAAEELRDRVSKATNIHEDLLRRTCTTIHAECYRLVRAADPSITIYGKGKTAQEPEDGTGAEGDVPMDSLFKIIGRDGYAKMLAAWHFVRAMRRREDFVYTAKLQFGPETADLCKNYVPDYEAAKKSCNQIDFTDMLERALEDRRCAPPRRKLLIVDEVQDCSVLQWDLIDHWATFSEYVIFVGDPDQTIHEWCGALYSKFIEVIESGFEVRRLAQSYRVPRIAYKLAMRMINKNEERIEVPYAPADRDGEFKYATIEAAIRDLERAAKSGESAFVLCPTKAACASWATSLTSELLPFHCERGNPGPMSGERRKAIARALLCIRARVEPDIADLERLVDAMPKRSMPEKWKSIQFFPNVTKAEVLREAAGCLEGFDAAGVNFDPLRCGSSLLDCLEMLKIEESDRPTFFIAEKWGIEVFKHPPNIKITTMHGSKGREAELVVLDMEITNNIKNATAQEIEAWRRVVYVAFTRTRNRLVQVGSSLEKFLLK